MGGASVIAFVLLLSFAVDRVVSGLLFALAWSDRWRAFCPTPAEVPVTDKPAAERKYKTVYFLFAAILSLGLLSVVKSGVLVQMGFAAGPMDLLLTALILMGGAERVSAFSSTLKTPGAVQVEPPLQIKGTLTLEEGTIRRLRGEDV